MERIALLLTCAVAAGILAEPQPLELDHLSIVVSPGGGGERAVEAAGFRLLPPGTTLPHSPGTASRIVGFENVYIELIWVTDRAALAAADAELAPRMVHDDPKMVGIGLALRRHSPGDSVPFPTRTAAAMRPQVARTANHEPYVSVVPAELGWLADSSRIAAALPHPNGAQRVTQVTFVHRKRGGGTAVMEYVHGVGIVRSGLAGTDYFLEIELDDGRQGKRIDLRPQLPLVFRR